MNFSATSLKTVIKHRNFPILALLTLSLLVGIFTFQDYGMTWDEYLYYSYADAVGYAYSIPEHLSEDFDITNAYGISKDDHKNRGPAYLLLMRNGVNAIHLGLGVDKIALWHLFNFFTYLVGIFFFYKLALRWLKPCSAFGASLLYLTQPLLWGHGFINPKDPPFTTIFIATIYFGFQMVDKLSITGASKRTRVSQILLVGILLGLATNLRIIAPFIGVLIFIYALLKRGIKAIVWFIPIGIVAILTTYATWPYLWDAPIARFIEVLTLMSNNPTSLKVLFMGQIYPAYDLPTRYLPWLMGITLTEVVFPLFFIGLAVAFARWRKKQLEWQTLGIVFFWFAFMMLYVLIMQPPMYDGYRHFLFILPPVFIFTGFAFEWLSSLLRNRWLRASLLTIASLSGIFGIINLYPYEYTYYNAFVGGTGNAFRNYETDYWLTCYKEAVEEFNQIAPPDATLLVVREPRNAAYFTNESITVLDYDEYWGRIKPSDFVLITSRSNEDQFFMMNSPIVADIGREGASFCTIKQVK